MAAAVYVVGLSGVAGVQSRLCHLSNPCAYCCEASSRGYGLCCGTVQGHPQGGVAI
jgi:hypothetical protein